jgi:hypothetical protein
MSGSTTAIWVIVIVVVVALAILLILVRYAAEHPGHKLRRRERMRGVVQGGQHIGGGRSVMPHRDAPVPEDGSPPGPEAPDVEDMEGDAASRTDAGGRARRPGSGSPMDL